MITARAFHGKRYALYGLARSGLATASALLASGAQVSAWDANDEARAKAPPGTNIVKLDEADLFEFDSLVVTPGLPLNHHPIGARARAAAVEIIGDIELFARARPELAPHKVVGITGTNGKSTTTALIHHILKRAGLPTTMGGNIGLPILGQDPLPENGIYVLELSSYQIDLMKGLDCDVAVLLNITPDHLDRYEGFDAYAAAKARLFGMQSQRRCAIIDRRADADHHLLANSIEPRAAFIDEALTGDQSAWPNLKGPHNLDNARAATIACRCLGLSDEAIEAGLQTYPGLPHRMERVREKSGVLFVNDSKATNPAASAPALAAFERIRWIVGGQAKTDELGECVPHFSHVASAYTIGDAAELYELLLAPHMPVKNCGKLEVAVRDAAADAAPGDTVLFSPACASFDQFRDFEDRGDQFRALVGAL